MINCIYNVKLKNITLHIILENIDEFMGVAHDT